MALCLAVFSPPQNWVFILSFVFCPAFESSSLQSHNAKVYAIRIITFVEIKFLLEHFPFAKHFFDHQIFTFSSSHCYLDHLSAGVRYRFEEVPMDRFGHEPLAADAGKMLIISAATFSLQTVLSHTHSSGLLLLPPLPLQLGILDVKVDEPNSFDHPIKIKLSILRQSIILAFCN